MTQTGGRLLPTDQAYTSLFAADWFAQGALDALEAHIVILDANGIIMAVNRAWREFAAQNNGLTGNTSYGINYIDVCLASASANVPDGLAVAEGIRDVLKGALESFRLEYPCHSPIENRWFVLRVTRFLIGGHAFAVVSHQNITLRKQREQDVELLGVRLQLATEAGGFGIWEYDVGLGLVVLDETMVNMYGLNQKSFSGSWQDFVARVHPEDAPLFQADIKLAMQGKKPLNIQCRILQANGVECWGNLRAVVHFNAEGVPFSVIGTCINVTAFKDTERQLTEARLEAERANHAKSQFISCMSHELRTPMNAVLGFAQLMEMDTTLSTENQESLEQIIKAGSHLLELINDVLNLSKFEEGNVQPVVKTVNAADVAAECLALVTPLAQQRSIRLAALLPTVDALATDRRMLKQILINLLANAIKYNRPDGEVKLTIERAENGEVLMKVSDTGFGIPADRLTELFQPFTRLEAEESATEGSGIGLVVSKRLANALGGDIEVASQVNVGSTFCLRLPAKV